MDEDTRPIYRGNKDPDRRKVVSDYVRSERVADPDTALWFPADRGAATTLYFLEFAKTSTIFAARVPFDFRVDTIEGMHDGKAGDWLAVGVEGELYPIDRKIFESSYVPVPAKPASDRDLIKAHVDRLLAIGRLMILPTEMRDYAGLGVAIADALNDIPALRKVQS